MRCVGHRGFRRALPVAWVLCFALAAAILACWQELNSIEVHAPDVVEISDFGRAVGGIGEDTDSVSAPSEGANVGLVDNEVFEMGCAEWDGEREGWINYNDGRDGVCGGRMDQ